MARSTFRHFAHLGTYDWPGTAVRGQGVLQFYTPTKCVSWRPREGFGLRANLPGPKSALWAHGLPLIGESRPRRPREGGLGVWGGGDLANSGQDLCGNWRPGGGVG